MQALGTDCTIAQFESTGLVNDVTKGKGDRGERKWLIPTVPHP